MESHAFTELKDLTDELKTLDQNHNRTEHRLLLCFYRGCHKRKIFLKTDLTKFSDSLTFHVSSLP